MVFILKRKEFIGKYGNQLRAHILCYLSDCFSLDNDPFIKEMVMLNGVDTHTLLRSKKYTLDEEHFKLLLEKVFKKPKNEAEIVNRYQTLAINKLSIDIAGKQYVIAYRCLTLNFQNMSLKIADHTSINKSFLIEGKKVSLGSYLDKDQNEFCATYDSNEEEYKQHIQGNLRHGEIINTRPTIFLLGRESQKGIEQTLEAIYEMDCQDKMTLPLKAFFGRNKGRRASSKEVNIVISDRNKINIDQMRVVYNSMISRVTYVKGPPGTGKTETILNVVLSAYANGKTVLVCSNNNHPVNDISKKIEIGLMKKMRFSEQSDFFFPMIRFGNVQEMKNTIIRLRRIVTFVINQEKRKVQEKLTEASKNRSLSNFGQLKDLITEYESQIDLIEKVERLKKIRGFTNVERINKKLDELIVSYQEALNKSAQVKDEDVMRRAVSASEDKNFQNYVFYSSLLRFRKLLTPTYERLREILAIEDLNIGASQLNKYLKDDVQFRRLLNVFPIVLCTNLSCEKLGSPKPHFDLVVMDESGQCNIASSLIPMIRGENLLLIGDTNQLQPVTVIEQSVNERLRNKYGVGDEYDYVKNSILSTMLRKDNNSKSILLRYHYRCGRKIANFVNQRFYDKQLKLLNTKEGSLVYCNVKNTRNPSVRNAYREEASQIARIVYKNRYEDVGIITPFVNQAALINEYLAQYGINNVKAGTIHTLQGSEKSVIILSTALSPSTGKKTMDCALN